MQPYFTQATIWAAQPYVWGWSDCVTCPADWVQRCTGVDPMDGLRGTYTSFSEAERAYSFFSDPMRVAGARMDALLGRTDDAQGGDVGFIHMPGDYRPMPHGALCLGSVQGRSLWVVRTPSGVAQIVGPKPLVIWRVPPCA